jgi:hypothetical protein
MITDIPPNHPLQRFDCVGNPEEPFAEGKGWAKSQTGVCGGRRANRSPALGAWCIMSRNSTLTVLLLSGVMPLLGCTRTVTGGFEDSPDKKYRMYGRVYGALGKAFLDETPKTLRISIVTNDSAETLIFRKKIRVKGSDVRWDCIWNENEKVTVIVFDYGPGVYWEDARQAGIPSNYLASVSLIRNKRTGKFQERN